MKRSKVRRNYLSYLRERSGKSARLAGKDFDRAAVNDVSMEEAAEVVEAEADVDGGVEVAEVEVKGEVAEAAA